MSNLTAIDCQCYLLPCAVQWLGGSCIAGPRKKFSHTVNNGTNDLMDLAIFCGACSISACESSRQSWRKALPDGLEGTLNCGRAGKCSPERPLDAAGSSS